MNTAYRKYAEGIESGAKQAAQIASIFEAYKKQLDKIGSERAELANKAESVYAKVKEEKLPENISEQICGASRLFVEQYTNPSMRAKGLDTILKGITIFDTDK